MVKLIKDPIHGYIDVQDHLLPLLDTPEVQRLHHILQLGFSYLVYPGAKHTRFEHSLGVMHLASILCKHIGLSEIDSLTVCIAGLLHDIGHGPYSHASERLMQTYGDFSHDMILPLLQSNEIAEILEKNNICPKTVADIVAGVHPLAPIIHGDLDVDRMDYLLRDAYYTGVPYGMIDASRLIQSIDFIDGYLVINDENISAAEALLISRTLMGSSALYNHHLIRITESMFIVAARAHFSENPKSMDTFMRLDDMNATYTLLNSSSDTARNMMNRIWSRRLYKRAVSVSRMYVDVNRFTHLEYSDVIQISKAIAESANVPQDAVILDIPPLKKEIHLEVKVRSKHDQTSLDELIPLLSIANETRKNQWRLSVYAPFEFLDAVNRAAYDLLEIERATKQDKLTVL